MKEMIKLAKLFINESWGISLLLYNKDYNKKAFFKQLGLMILLVAVLTPSFFMYISFMGITYAGLKYVGQSSSFLVIGFVMTTVLIIVFGIMQILSEFYFSKNIEELIPLPLTPEKIIIGKFMSILASEYLFTAAAFLPVLFIYGIGEGMGLVYAILAILVFLALPVIPLALLSALLMLVMKGAAIKGRKDLIQMIFSFLMIALILGAQFYFSSRLGAAQEGDLQDILNKMLQNNEWLLNRIGYFMPTALLVARGLNVITPMSLVWIGAFLGIAAFSVLLLVGNGKYFYLNSLISGSSSKKSKELSDQQRQKKIGRTKLMALAIFSMDFRNLLRTPVYFSNNVSVVVIVPVCIVIGFSISGVNQMDLSELKKMYAEWPMLFNYGLIGFFAFFGSTSAATATSFSREGKKSWITRIIPVLPREQIIGRTMTGLLIQGMGIFFTIIAVCYFLPLKFSSISIAVILGLLGSLPVLLFGLLIDLNRPMINWDNPQKAVKNNMNVVITLFAGMLYVGVVIAVSMALGYFVNNWLGYLFFILISTGFSVLLFQILNRQFDRKLMSFDD